MNVRVHEPHHLLNRTAVAEGGVNHDPRLYVHTRVGTGAIHPNPDQFGASVKRSVVGKEVDPNNLAIDRVANDLVACAGGSRRDGMDHAVFVFVVEPIEQSEYVVFGSKATSTHEGLIGLDPIPILRADVDELVVDALARPVVGIGDDRKFSSTGGLPGREERQLVCEMIEAAAEVVESIPSYQHESSRRNRFLGEARSERRANRIEALLEPEVGVTARVVSPDPVLQRMEVSFRPVQLAEAPLKLRLHARDPWRCRA